MTRIGLIAGFLAAAIALDVFGTAAAGTSADCDSVLRSLDTAASIRCLQPYADAGDPEAELQLGSQYDVSNGNSDDAQKAAYWTRRAAEHGNLFAQWMVGRIYLAGQGVSKDLSEALKWFRIAAERGDQQAQNDLALMYFKGWGTPRDVEQAIFWEKKAAAQGGALAMVPEMSIAGIYLHGDGVPKDYAEAARWFRKAAADGSPTAYWNLASLDEQGAGGPPDPVEAYEGYSIALAWLQSTKSPTNIIEFTAKHRDGVAAKLNPTQRADADRFVREHQREVR